MFLDTTAQLFLCLLIIAMWILAFFVAGSFAINNTSPKSRGQGADSVQKFTSIMD